MPCVLFRVLFMRKWLLQHALSLAVYTGALAGPECARPKSACFGLSRYILLCVQMMYNCSARKRRALMLYGRGYNCHIGSVDVEFVSAMEYTRTHAWHINAHNCVVLFVHCGSVVFAAYADAQILCG